jgi:hypothetical protein
MEAESGAAENEQNKPSYMFMLAEDFTWYCMAGNFQGC